MEGWGEILVFGGEEKAVAFFLLGGMEEGGWGRMCES